MTSSPASALSTAWPDVRAWARFAYDAWMGRPATLPDRPLPETDLRRLRLAPLVYHAMRAAGDPRAPGLAADDRHATVLNLWRLAQMAPLRDRLEAQGLVPVLLKGGAFLVRFARGRLGLRPMGDVDLLVPAGQFDAAAAALLDAGLIDAVPGRTHSARVAGARPFVRRDGALDLEVDLHRGLAPWPLLRPLTAQVIERRERLGGWWVPSELHTVLAASLHRARHGFIWGAIDLLEVQRITEAWDEGAWGRAIEESHRHRIAGAALVTIRQASWVFADPDRDTPQAGGLRRLAERMGPVKRRVLARISPPATPLDVDPAWCRPLPRNLVINPAALSSTWQALAAAASFLPRRAAEEWLAAGGSAGGTAARVRTIWRLLRRGTEPEPTSPLPKRDVPPGSSASD